MTYGLRSSSTVEQGIVWRVAVVCQEEELRSIKWTFDSGDLTEERVDFTRLSLDRLASEASDFHMILLLLDMGQPVPRQTLYDLAKKPGLCALVQPTPQQLLDVGDLPSWRAMRWEKGDYPSLCTEILRSLEYMEDEIKRIVFSENIERWVSTRIKVPYRLEFSNPPSDFVFATTANLDPTRGKLSVGCAESKCDLRLPFKGFETLLSFDFQKGQWSCRESSDLKVDFVIPRGGRDLRSGDSIRIGSFDLDLHPSKSVEELLGILDQAGMKRSPVESLKQEHESILDLFQEFMLGALTGELRVTSNERRASVFLESGRIQQVICGSTYGYKALIRVFSWPEFRWSFNIFKRMEFKLPSMEMPFLELRNVYARWELRWKKLAAYAPNPALRLRIKPDVFRNRKEWSHQDFSVAAAICQYERIGDILNNCPMLDIDIIDSMVRLRKQGLLAVVEEKS